MSNEFDDDADDIDEAETAPPEDGNGPKALRAELKKLKAARAAELIELEQFRKQSKQTGVAAALQALGARPSLAKFYEGEASEDAVKQWLETNKEDFGWQPPNEGDQDEVDEETADQAQRISTVTTNAPPRTPPNAHQKLGDRSIPYKDLVAAGLVPNLD